MELNSAHNQEVCYIILLLDFPSANDTEVKHVSDFIMSKLEQAGGAEASGREFPQLDCLKESNSTGLGFSQVHLFWFSNYRIYHDTEES